MEVTTVGAMIQNWLELASKCHMSVTGHNRLLKCASMATDEPKGAISVIDDLLDHLEPVLQIAPSPLHVMFHNTHVTLLTKLG